jgi:hypothetical protein
MSVKSISEVLKITSQYLRMASSKAEFDENKLKNGVYKGDLGIFPSMVKGGKLQLPVELKEITGNFHCSNIKLTSLKGVPQKVGESFFCSHNKLTSLEGAPQNVGEGFYCHDNNLTSLKGIPQTIGRNFNCSENNLTSLKGAPQTVGGHFFCSDNPGKFTEEDVKAVCDVKGKIVV